MVPNSERTIMNILIVDDEPEYRFLLSHYLEDCGYKVFTAEHGEAGLKRLDYETIDLIISDVYMPIMDGLKFHRIVRSIPRFEKIPFLFVSGYDDEYTLSAVKSSRVDGFVRKARPMSELDAWIKYLLTPMNKRPDTPPSQLPWSVDKPRKRDRSLKSARKSD